MKAGLVTGALLSLALSGSALGQLVRPPSGGVLDRYLAPPSGLEQQFLGTWNLTWNDLADPDCPCHGTLQIDVEQDGTLRGHWTMKGGTTLLLLGDVAFDQNVWAGTFVQTGDGADFPLKGHFRLEARGGTALTGSYEREGLTIPYSWSATRR
jgi:hypothetical protein